MGGGGSSGETTSTTTQELSPEQKKILGLATPIFTNYLKQGMGLKDLAYGGQTFAGPTGSETMGAEMLKGTAQGALQNSTNTSLSGLNFLTSGQALDPRTNPALQGTIDAAVRPIVDNYSNVIMPQTDAASVLSGGYGSNRLEMNKRLAGESMLRQVGDTSSQIAFQGYNQGLDSMTKAMAFGPSVQASALLPGQTMAQVGGFERGFEQAAIQDEMSRFYNQNFFPLMIAQQIAGTAFGYPGGSTLASTQGAGGGGNSQLTGALGGAVGGAAMGTAIMPGWGTAAGAVMGGLMGLLQ